MQEKNISKYTAAKLIEKYYQYHFCDLISVKAKPKIENNDLYILVKIQSVLNHRKIVEKIILNEGQIKNILMDYLEINYCSVDDISYEPYFHNLNIRYNGSLNLEPKKGFIKMKRVI